MNDLVINMSNYFIELLRTLSLTEVTFLEELLNKCIGDSSSLQQGTQMHTVPLPVTGLSLESIHLTPKINITLFYDQNQALAR